MQVRYQAALRPEKAAIVMPIKKTRKAALTPLAGWRC